MAPYGKVFDSIFGSSIMESDVETRYIWMCMIITADKEGFIDETIPALARRFNVPVESMERAIKCFMEPDASSRTPDKDGRRIEPIRESFGWKIINYDYYRNLRDDEQRREYMREYMRKYREGPDDRDVNVNKVNGSLQGFTCKQRKPQLANTDTDTDTDKPPYPLNVKFTEFWNLYPKKKSKGQAEKAWKKIKPNDGVHSNIMAGLNRALKSDDWLKDNGQFIPYPATWLNSKGWEDEYINRPTDRTIEGTPQRCKVCKETGIFINEDGVCTLCSIKAGE